MQAGIRPKWSDAAIRGQELAFFFYGIQEPQKARCPGFRSGLLFSQFCTSSYCQLCRVTSCCNSVVDPLLPTSLAAPHVSDRKSRQKCRSIRPSSSADERPSWDLLSCLASLLLRHSVGAEEHGHRCDLATQVMNAEGCKERTVIVTVTVRDFPVLPHASSWLRCCSATLPFSAPMVGE